MSRALEDAATTLHKGRVLAEAAAANEAKLAAVAEILSRIAGRISNVEGALASGRANAAVVDVCVDALRSAAGLADVASSVLGQGPAFIDEWVFDEGERKALEALGAESADQRRTA